MGIKEWLVPKQDLDSLVDKAMESDEIKNRDDFKEYVAESYKENKFMRNFATVVDVWDKLLVPVDVAGDYMKIVGGAGYGISTAKEIAEMAVKLPYMIYFTAKTKKVRLTAFNLGYEALSFLVPGSVLDLNNMYVREADEYIVERAKERFLENK